MASRPGSPASRRVAPQRQVPSISQSQQWWLSTTRSPHFLKVIETFEVILDFKVALDSILLESCHHVSDGQTVQFRGFSKRSLSGLVLLDVTHHAALVNEVANRN